MDQEKLYDWSKFVRRISINAPVQKIYDAWTSRSGIESWFLRKGEFKSAAGIWREADEPINKHDTYEWMWHGWSDETEERGEILDANGKDYLSFEFGKEGIVHVNIHTEEGETVVELTQEQIPAGEKDKVSYHLGCSIGWTFYLTNLKSILEGGLDLRNKNILLKKVINS